MLSLRLTNCPECANIPSILRKIDCKLAELGNNLYNNISYMLNKPIPASDILRLIGYKRILTNKYYNPNYLPEYSINSISSKVIRLTNGCVSRCNTPEPCLVEPCNIEVVPNYTTTTTTTANITNLPYFFGRSVVPTTVNQELINSGTEVYGDSTGTLNITFGASGEYIWFAIPNTSTKKTKWYVDFRNNSNIGKVSDLFNNYTLLNVDDPSSVWFNKLYKVYLSNYPTTTSGIIELTNL